MHAFLSLGTFTHADDVWCLRWCSLSIELPKCSVNFVFSKAEQVMFFVNRVTKMFSEFSSSGRQHRWYHLSQSLAYKGMYCNDVENENNVYIRICSISIQFDSRPSWAGSLKTFLTIGIVRGLNYIEVVGRSSFLQFMVINDHPHHHGDQWSSSPPWVRRFQIFCKHCIANSCRCTVYCTVTQSSICSVTSAKFCFKFHENVIIFDRIAG